MITHNKWCPYCKALKYDRKNNIYKCLLNYDIGLKHKRLTSPDTLTPHPLGKCERPLTQQALKELLND